MLRCVQINKKLVLIKAHFFFFTGALACVIPPLILYCQQLGASVSMVGVLFAVLPFVQCLVKPITGGIADKFQIPKTVFIASIIMLTVSAFSINFVPEMLQHSTANASLESASGRISCKDHSLELCTSNVSDTEGVSNLLRILQNHTLTCDVSEKLQLSTSGCNGGAENCSYFIYRPATEMSPATTRVNLGVSTERTTRISFESANDRSNCTMVDIVNVTSANSGQVLWTTANSTHLCPNDEDLQVSCDVQGAPDVEVVPVKVKGGGAVYQFVWVWIACVIMWSSFGTILSTSDAILLNVLGDNRDQYGMTRLYSSIGWGLFSAIAGQLIDWVSGDSSRKDYAPVFYLFLALMVCDFLLALRMKVQMTETPKHLTKEITKLFKNVEFTLFTLAIFFTGMTTGVMWTFLVVYAFELNGSQLIIGLNYAVECFFSEIPFFMASGWIVQKLGHTYSMCFVLVLTGFKCMLYGFIDNAWYILIIALIHGANYGVFYATAATYASIAAPPGASTTIQGVFQGIFEGAGVGCGSLLGGIIYEQFGGRILFLAFGVATMIIGCLYGLINFLCKKRQKTSPSSGTGEESGKSSDLNENIRMSGVK